MIKRLLALAVVCAVSVLGATRLDAHHLWPVSRTRLVTVKGTVTRVAWSNPHPMFTVEVPVPGAGTEEWQIGGPALNRMEANGWTRMTVKVGDAITGIGYQFSDGQKIVRLERVVLADGKEMRVYGD